MLLATFLHRPTINTLLPSFCINFIRFYQAGETSPFAALWLLHSPGIREQKPWDRNQQYSTFECGIKDQAVTVLWDQGTKRVMLWESRIRNLVTKMGSALKKYDPDISAVSNEKYD